MIKSYKLIFTILLSISLDSQELDSDFINTLPDDIKKDLQEQNNKKSISSELNYKPYLYSSKLKQAEELLNVATVKS